MALRAWFFGILISLIPVQVLACSCISREPDEYAADIPVLFEGALIVPMPSAIFRVDKVYKGRLGDWVRVAYSAQDDFTCGISFEIGLVTLVAAYGDEETGYP